MSSTVLLVVWENGHVEIIRSQVMFYVSKQKDLIKFLFPDVILYYMNAKTF